MVVNQLNPVLSIVAFLLITSLAASIGLFALGRLQVLTFSCRTVCFSITLGLGFLGTLLSWLSLARLFDIHVVLPTMVFLFLVFVRYGFRFLKNYFKQSDSLNRLRKSHITKSDLLLIGWFAAVLMLYFLGALAPSTGGDALWHNLAMPKVIATQSSFLDVWQLRIGPEHTETPKLVDHFYALGMLLGSDTISTLLNFLFLLVVLAIVLEFTFHHTNLHYALWSVLAVALMPVITHLGRESKLDLGLALFELSAVYCFYLFKTEGKLNWLLLASLFVGFALGVRYNALVLVIILTILLMYDVLNDRTLRLQWRKVLAAWVLPATAVAALWYIGNLVQYGNPLFPFYDSIIRALYPVGSFTAILHWSTIDTNYLDQFRVPMRGWFGWLYPFWFFSFNQPSRINTWSEMWGPLILSALPLMVLTRVFQETWVRWALVYVVLSYLFWVNQLHITRTFVGPLTVATVVAVIAILRTPIPYRYLLLSGLITLLLWSSLILLRGSYGCIPFAFGLESREAFLQRELPRVPIFPSLRMASFSYSLPDSSKVLLYNWSSGYYMKSYTCGLSRPASSPQDFLEILHEDRITHIYFNDYPEQRPSPNRPEADPILSTLIGTNRIECVFVDTVRPPSSMNTAEAMELYQGVTECTQYLYRVTD